MNKCTCSYDDNMHDFKCAVNGNVVSDPLLSDAKEWSLKEGYVSVSYLQRILRIGYTRAARLVELLIEEGFCEEARVQVDSPRHKIVSVDQSRAADSPVKSSMSKGYKFAVVNCPNCQLPVKENWLVKHIKSDCKMPAHRAQPAA